MKYRANPVEVDAFVIMEVLGAENDPRKGTTYHLRLDDRKEVTATPEMCSRMTPAVGDFWVIQSDGYIYLNPKDVFQRKYSPMVDL